MENLGLLITIFLMLITLIILVVHIYKKYSKKSIAKVDSHNSFNKRNKIDFDGLKRIITDFNKKETLLFFHCDKLIHKYYSKLIIFNKEYNLDENDIIKIKVEKGELFNSDFNASIILKSDKEEIKFVINISYFMNNHYQIILDKIKDSLSLAFVIYSKENKFPGKINEINKNKLCLKDYGDNSIPYLKKYNIINLSRQSFYNMYNYNCTNKIEEKSNLFLDEINSFFVNFVIKDKNSIKGRIFEQKEDYEYKDFTKDEINLLNEIKILIVDNFTKDKTILLSDLKYSMFQKCQKLFNEKKKIVESIIEKFDETCYFNKYYGKEIKEEIFDLMDSIIFINYIKEKGISGINNYLAYLDYKNNIFSNNSKFNNFEKLMLIINIQYLVLKVGDFKFVKFDDLPIDSPFVESEKLMLDIIKNLKENSALYFFYLQINSLSGLDYISLDTWFQIKFISLNQIKAHLLNIRYPFFFLYKKVDEKGAFVNPQNLIINFNTHPDVGYNYLKNLENEMNEDNTIRILFLKFHESAHSKFDSINKKDISPRYLLNFDLEELDSHYDSITSSKKEYKLSDMEKKGDDVGEEGYGLEMFLYGSIAKTDVLLRTLNHLKDFNNVNLYIQNNFNELNNLIKNLKDNQLIYNEYAKKDSKVNAFQERNVTTIKTPKKNNEKNTPFFYFKNYPIEANY